MELTPTPPTTPAYKRWWLVLSWLGAIAFLVWWQTSTPVVEENVVPVVVQKTATITWTHQRSAEALALAENSDGKIVLRADGKIDFPQIGVIWVQILHSNELTDLVWPNWLTYMSREKAQEVAEKKWLTLFTVNEESFSAWAWEEEIDKKIAQPLLFQFWTSSKEQIDLLHILFWVNILESPTPFCLGLAYNANNGLVRTICWDSIDTAWYLHYRGVIVPFLAFESIAEPK